MLPVKSHRLAWFWRFLGCRETHPGHYNTGHVISLWAYPSALVALVFASARMSGVTESRIMKQYFSILIGWLEEERDKVTMIGV